MASVKLFLVFAFLATLSICSARRFNFNYDFNDNDDEERTGRSYQNWRRGSSARGTAPSLHFPMEELQYAFEKFPKITYYLRYLRELDDHIKNQRDFENGQFARLVHEISLDAHTKNPGTVPSKSDIHNSFEDSFAAGMGNYTMLTQEKLRSVKSDLSDVLFKLCPVVDEYNKKMKNLPTDEQLKKIAIYIETNSYGAQQINGILKCGELFRKVEEIKFNHIRNEVARAGAGRFVLLHRPQTEDLAHAINMLLHSVAIIEKPMPGLLTDCTH